MVVLSGDSASRGLFPTIRRLRAGGLDIVEVGMPAGFDAIDAAANTIHDYEMHRALKPELLVARAGRCGRRTGTPSSSMRAAGV